MWNILHIYYNEISTLLMLYLPFGLIGAWRWAVWLVRKFFGLRYKPAPYIEMNLTTSVITPVYNEDPKVFRRALESWASNRPHEIIAVIDHADKACIAEFKEFAKTFPRARMHITKVPGKREALVTGSHLAHGEILALVDSDTIWDQDSLRFGLCPFADPKVGGVTLRQNVLAPEALAAKLFDIHLDTRYLEEVRFLAAVGDAVTCISGRTGLYRREAIMPALEGLLNEQFLGKRVISGDDKRLTQLVQGAGWSVRYQENARVYTPAFREMRTFLKQRVRWARNSWRSDFATLMEPWVWRKPVLAIHLMDRAVQPFTTLVSPAYLLLSLFRQNWWMVWTILAWLIVSRGIKIFPSIRRRPAFVFLLPAYILFTYVFAVVRIFAFFSMNQQGWITRWDKSRLQAGSLLRSASSYVSTCAALISIFVFVQLNHSTELMAGGGLNIYESEAQLPGYHTTTGATAGITVADAAHLSLEAPVDTFGATGNGQGAALFTSPEPSTLTQIAHRFGFTPDELGLAADQNGDGLWQPSDMLQIPRRIHDATAYRQMIGEIQQSQTGEFFVKYSKTSQMITLSPPVTDSSTDSLTSDLTSATTGNDLTVVDLPSLYRQLNDETLLAYEGDGIYLLKRTLRLKANVVLLIEAPAVKWLKLQSDENGYAYLFGKHASVIVRSSKITSWDATINHYDETIEDGRSYLYIKNGRMDIVNSELAYLGYKPSEKSIEAGVYGLSWRASDFDIHSFEQTGREYATGYIDGNIIHHNYFGMYSFGVTGLVMRNNEVYGNKVYGIDPHDDSDHMIIEYNYSHDNAVHGIILSKRCTNNIIRGNRTINNQINGIMMDQQSDNNSIYDNIVTDNADGIVMWDSHQNDIYNNQVSQNNRGIRMNVKSSQNGVHENQISQSEAYGIYFYDGADNNWVWKNKLEKNRAGVYLQAKGNRIFANQISDGTQGVYLTPEASENLVVGNELIRNTTALYLKSQANNQLHDNLFASDITLRNAENIRLVTE